MRVKGLDQGLGQSSLVLHHVLSADRESVMNLVTLVLLIAPEIKGIICKVKRLLARFSECNHCLTECIVWLYSQSSLLSFQKLFVDRDLHV